MLPETQPASSAPTPGAPGAEAPKASQRRASYRVQIYSGSDFSMQTWRLTETASLDRVPSSVHLISEQVKDISESGACILIRTGTVKPVVLQTGDRLRTQLKCGKFECVFEGRVRLHPGAPHHPDGSPTRTGIHFKADKNTPAGRQNLATLGKIIAQLRREELRFQRLGLSR